VEDDVVHRKYRPEWVEDDMMVGGLGYNQYQEVVVMIVGLSHNWAVRKVGDN
jgi:hypothetical protein